MITKTHYSFDDIGCALSWRDFIAFVKFANSDFAIYRITHAEIADWQDGKSLRSYQLANIIDAISETNFILRCAFGSERPDIPKPTYRPNLENNKPAKKKFDAQAFKKLLHERYD